MCVTRINIRLRKLYDHNYLSRRFAPKEKGSSQAVYSVSKASVELISHWLGEDPDTIRRRAEDDLRVKDVFLAHNLMVNDVLLKGLEQGFMLSLETCIVPHPY